MRERHGQTLQLQHQQQPEEQPGCQRRLLFRRLLAVLASICLLGLLALSLDALYSKSAAFRMSEMLSGKHAAPLPAGTARNAESKVQRFSNSQWRHLPVLNKGMNSVGRMRGQRGSVAKVLKNLKKAGKKAGQKQPLPAHRRNGTILQPSDFVVAIPGHKDSKVLFAAGRAARQGLRTFLATSYEATKEEGYPAATNETWAYYPDDNPRRSWYPGDSRAAIAPFLAFKHLSGSYKWLFYGDDDTLFFVHAALEVVKHLDPNRPYVLTDNLWWSSEFDATYHPHSLAPRCLPCRYPSNASFLHIQMAAGCPCTPEVMCRGAGYSSWEVKGCKDSWQPYALHGGAGALFSVGALRKVNFTTLESCILQQHDSGGDAFLTTCLWKQDLAITTPDPLAHPSGQPAFDPSPGPLHPDDYTINKATYVLGNLLQHLAGTCEGLCQLELRHTVSLHLRARRTGGSQQGTAAFVRLFSRLANRAHSSAGALALNNSSTDVLEAESSAIAAEIDAHAEAGIAAVWSLAKVVKASLRHEQVHQLDLKNKRGLIILASNKLLAAAANAAAEQVLRAALDAVKPFAVRGFEDDACTPEAEQYYGKKAWWNFG